MPADPGHLLFGRLPQIFQGVKAVSDLLRLPSALTGSLRIQPAAIAADDPNGRMRRQPACRFRRRSYGQYLGDLPRRQVGDDGSVMPALALAPVIDADDAQGSCAVLGCGGSFQVPQYSVVTGWHSQSPLDVSTLRSAGEVTKQPHKLDHPTGAPRDGSHGVGWPLYESRTTALLAMAPPSRDTDLDRDRDTLNR